jgi:gliding motility-associated-like protein
MKKIYLSFIFSLFALFVNAQCPVTGPFDIADNASLTLGISVNTLDNPDLSAGQGICGVRIKFRHSHIGDLVMKLIAPSGQEILLTGPSTATQATDLTVWDITFIGCGQTASPDPGISAVWNNDQAWAILAAYSGTYYPHSGCFEDFNSGSALGIWQIVIEDSQEFDTGVLESFELIFCDPSGLDCQLCSANGGRLPVAQYKFCEGIPPLNPNFTPEFLGFEPSSDYAYFYFIIKDGRVQQVNNQIDLENLSDGIQYLRGISLLASDTSKFQTMPANLDQAQFEDWLRGEGICYAISDNTTRLDVYPSNPNTILDYQICIGDSIEYDGMTYKPRQSTLLQVPLIDRNGCDSLILLDVTVINLDPQINAVGEFTCQNRIIDLVVNDPSIPSGDLTYHWFSEDGLVGADSLQRTIEVSKSGTYFVEISYEGCIDTGFYEVINDYQYPELTFLSDPITCINDSSTVFVVSDLPGTGIQFQDPNGNLYSVNELRISSTDAFNIIMTSPFGCLDTVPVILPYDNEPPMVTQGNILKQCPGDTLAITPDSINPNWSYDWITPSGIIYTDTLYLPSFETGLHRLIVVGENGCETEIPFEITSNIIQAEFNVQSDTFSCLTDSISINFSSNTTEVWQAIIGPNGYYSVGNQGHVIYPGTYRLLVQSIEGCYFDTLFTTPTKTEPVPTINIDGAGLTCLVDSVSLSVAVNSIDLEYLWYGPGGFLSVEPEVNVADSGWYYVNIATKNGCLLQDSFFVTQSSDVPFVELRVDSMKCTDDTVEIELITSESLTYQWSGPREYFSTSQNARVDTAGWYHVKVTDQFGCSGNYSIYVPTSYRAPDYQIDASTITCSQTASSVVVFTDAVDVNWTGPAGFQENGNFVNLPSIDSFYMHLTDLNGCDTQVLFIPPVDTLPPVLDAFNDVMGCDKDTVFLAVASDVPISDFLWTGKNGFNSNDPEPMVTDSGSYVIQATALNGCIALDTAFIGLDNTIPDVDVEGQDTINCERTTARINTINNSGLNLTYEWLHPIGRIYYQQNLRIEHGGTYVLTATAQSSCSVTKEFVVVKDNALPDYKVELDSVNCVKDSATIVISSSEDISVVWDGADPRVDSGLIIKSPVLGSYDFLVVNNRNKCINSGQAEIVNDTAIAHNHIITDTIINCANRPLKLRSFLTSDEAELIWNGPGINNVNSDTAFAAAAGTYYLQTTIPKGCIDFDTLVLGIDTTHAVIGISGDTLTCDNSKIQLLLSVNTSRFSTQWRGPGGFTSQTASPSVNVAGKYVVEVLTGNGCISTDSIIIFGDTLAPSVDVMIGEFTCFDTTAAVNLETQDEIKQLVWLGPDGFVAEGESIEVDRIGEYVLFSFGTNGCNDQDTFIIEDFDLISDANLIVNDINCYALEPTHYIASNDQITSYNWAQNGTTLSTTDSLISNLTNNLTIELVNISGCSWDTMFNVITDTISPVAQIQASDTIRCKLRQINLSEILLSPSSDYTFEWTTTNGQILSDPAVNSITIEDPGTYQLIAQDIDNGCLDTVIADVIERPNDLELGNISVFTPNCHNDFGGQIFVDEIVGGTAPIMYSLDSIDFGTSNAFEGLDPGDYVVYMVDQAGCELNAQVNIQNTKRYFVDIEKDTVILLGANLVINPSHNFEPNEINSFIWYVNDSVYCEDCEILEFEAVESGEYRLTIVDTNLCPVSDLINIKVLNFGAVYVPNAFSPNGDSVNDTFRPYFGNNVDRINEFSIYDRWGNRTYQLIDVDAQDESIGWDGVFRNKLMLPGIYVYQLDLTLVNGKKETRSGEVYLVR